MEMVNRYLEAVLKKLKLNPPQNRGVLVGGRSDPGNGLSPVLHGLTLPLKEQVHILDLSPLLDKQVEVVVRGALHQLLMSLASTGKNGSWLCGLFSGSRAGNLKCPKDCRQPCFLVYVPFLCH